MNIKELETLVLKQGAMIEAQHTALQAATEAHMHLVQRADNIVEGFKKELTARDERLDYLLRTCEALHDGLGDVKSHQDGMNDTLFGAVGRIETLEKLVLARNSSAPTKRNMTDEDALRVMTGDLKDLSHKDAAEKIGLTYAQVYSCRLEFTFKHVHKNLRDDSVDNQPWKNNWAK